MMARKLWHVLCLRTKKTQNATVPAVCALGPLRSFEGEDKEPWGQSSTNRKSCQELLLRTIPGCCLRGGEPGGVKDRVAAESSAHMTDESADQVSTDCGGSGWRSISMDEVGEFARYLLDPARQLPVVGLSTGPRETIPKVNPRSLAGLLRGRAEVAVLVNGPITYALAEALPRPELAVYGGAARIWWPGLEAESNPYDHPLLQNRGTSTELARQIVERVWPGPELVREQGSEFRQLIRDHEDAQGDIDRLREDLSQARQELQRLKKHLRTQEPSSPVAEVEFDPLESPTSFLTGLYSTMLRIYERNELAALVPNAVLVGLVFLESARTLSGVSPEKILEVCAHVVSGRAASLPGLALHPLREGPGGSDQRVRGSDGAKAWRCSLQTKTPSARRLHFWSVPGSSGPVIELASVGLHDDLSIPE